MSDIQHKREVLEAIDHLRLRKARPDINRITAYLSKKHGFSSDKTKQILSKCVEAGIVYRVEYKGFISYRNSTKSVHGRFRHNGTSSTPLAGCTLLTKVYSFMVSVNPEITEKGVSELDFVKALSLQQPRKTQEYFKVLIDRAVNHSFFTRLVNGNINITRIATTVSSPRSMRTSRAMQRKLWSLKLRTPSESHKISDGRKFNNRKKDRRKKNSKALEKRRKLILNNEESSNPNIRARDYRICGVCQKLIATDKTNHKIVDCATCSSKSHFSCAFDNVRTNSDQSWKCPQCISCKTCKKTSITDPLITCISCCSAYHRQCHMPNIKNDIEPSSFWLCSSCENKNDHNNQSAKSKFFCLPGLLSRIKYAPSEHKSIWQEFKERKYGPFEEGPVDVTIPDVTDWTTEQVYKYLNIVCPESARSFKERDVNGPYLLKMSRVEIIQGLGLKLGPALKVFKHVAILQKRRDDPTCYYL